MEHEDFTEGSLEAPSVQLLESLRNQISAVQSLHDESENTEECWGKLQVAAHNLKKHCSSSFEEIMNAHDSVHEEPQNDGKKFIQKCVRCMKSTQIHRILKKSIPGCFEELQEQQREYERLQTEVSINQQRFNSIIEKVLPSLESVEAEKRRQFICKVTELNEQWHIVSWVVHHRKKYIDGFVRLWHLFQLSLESLSRFLDDTMSFITSVKNQDCHRHCQRRNLIKDFKSKAVILQRWQAMFSVVIDAGEKLRSVSDPETSAALQEQLSQLQQSWGDTQVELEKMTLQLANTLQLTRRTADGGDGSSTSRSNQQGLLQSPSFFRRAVLRAFLLFALILLLVFSLTFVIVPSEEYYSCMNVNNFARSFSLMLQYPYGPPPS
ncbi:nesprin-2-like isoform X2 [Melanerpes formicivorus]|uniref:nesprin-2-like isoform X2 n=1 Tax=Melanerpes formicivorus TaxID=211600 RepID=UPI00358E85A5